MAGALFPAEVLGQVTHRNLAAAGLALGIEFQHADDMAVLHQARARQRLRLERDDAQRKDEQRIDIAVHDRVT